MRQNPNTTPTPRPVQKVELPETHFKLRLVAVFALIAVGVGALAFAINGWVNSGTGWQEIEVTSVADCPAGGDFTLTYDLGNKGGAARAVRRQLSALYTETLTWAAAQFDEAETHGYYNVNYLNAHAGETVSVSETLYAALETATANGARDLYLAPVYDYYRALFSVDGNDALAATHDALENPALRDTFAAFMAYTNDPAHVELRLLGEGRAELFVSEEYRAFAAANGAENRYIDFCWMKNAFITDAVADALIAAGYTAGVLSSFDGFTRVLGGTDAQTFTLYDRVAGKLGPVASFAAADVRALVLYRNFPLTAMDAFRFYTYENGETRTGYISAADGISHTVSAHFAAYGNTESCAALVMATKDLYIADAWDAESAAALPDAVRYVRSAGTTFCYHDATLTVSALHAAYTATAE